MCRCALYSLFAPAFRSRECHTIPPCTVVSLRRVAGRYDTMLVQVMEGFLGFSSDFSCRLEDRFSGKDEPILDEPPPLDNPLFIDQEERPPCHEPVGVPGVWPHPQQAIAPDDVEVWKVAEQRVGQLEGIRKRLLREGVVGADPENLDIQLRELIVIDLPGRQIRRSRRAEIVHVEFEEDVLLSPELAEADCFPCGAGECEVQRMLTDLHCHGHAGYCQHAAQQHAE